MNAPTPTSVDWHSILHDDASLHYVLRKREWLGQGTYGVVYRVGDVAFKIGCIEEAEVERQAWVHMTFRRALPVLAFRQSVELPHAITRQVCPIHGPLGLDRESWNCHCSEPMDILVMPLAETADRKTYLRVRRMIDEIKDALAVEFEFSWDDAARNLLRFRGRVILADFGWDTVDGW